jgi:GT2 family glycosyltransferase
MKKLLIIVITHKRPHYCAALLRQIEQQTGNFNAKVAVFHDKCDKDYSQTQEICSKNGWEYLVSAETFGKWGFWKLLNVIYAYQDNEKYDYFIQLPDDVILVDGFFDRLIGLIYDNKTCINFFTPNIYLKTYATMEKQLINGVEVWENGWLDSAFCTTKKIMKGFRIVQPMTSLLKKEDKGSGCGSEQSKTYFNKSLRRSLQTVYSLCEHLGIDDTVMHGKTRAVDKYGSMRYHLLSCNLTEEDALYVQEQKPNFKAMENKGNTVAIVGNAAYLYGSRLGAEIDNHDLVVRLNFNALLTGKLAADIGRKTNIVYLASTVFKERTDIVWPAGVQVKKKNGGLQNLKGLPNYCMNTGLIAAIEYAMQGYSVRLYGMDFYAGAFGGKIPEKYWNEGEKKGQIKVKKDLVYLPGYYEAGGLKSSDTFTVRHVGGMTDLRTILEYAKKYDITFDKHMQQVIIDNMKNENQTVDVFIASLYRGCHVKRTIESLLQCPELRSVTVVCNTWTDEQFEELRIYFASNIHVLLYRGNNKKGCSEKFRYFYTSKGKYICTCDDDLIYPADFLTRLIDASEKYQAVTSAHGRTLLNRKISNYYKEKKAVYHCLRDVENDVQVDIVGSGCTLIPRALIVDINDLYDYVNHPNMSDIYLSYLAELRGVDCYVIAHKAEWIKHKEMNVNDNYIFDEYKDSCPNQTEFVNRYFIKS